MVIFVDVLLGVWALRTEKERCDRELTRILWCWISRGMCRVRG